MEQSCHPPKKDDERWKPVPGYEDEYLVSDLGRVYSIPRGRNSGGLLSPGESHGYPIVCLWESGEPKMKAVHRLVLRAFVGEPEDGQEASHLNGERSDARLENLTWETRSENHRRKRVHETSKQGVKHHAAKVKEWGVRVIRFLASFDVPYSFISRMFGLEKSSISNIVTEKTWPHVV